MFVFLIFFFLEARSHVAHVGGEVVMQPRLDLNAPPWGLLPSSKHYSQLVCLDYTLEIKFNLLFPLSGFLFFNSLAFD